MRESPSHRAVRGHGAVDQQQMLYRCAAGKEPRVCYRLQVRVRVRVRVRLVQACWEHRVMGFNAPSHLHPVPSASPPGGHRHCSAWYTGVNFKRLDWQWNTVEPQQRRWPQEPSLLEHRARSVGCCTHWAAGLSMASKPSGIAHPFPTHFARPGRMQCMRDLPHEAQPEEATVQIGQQSALHRLWDGMQQFDNC